MTTDTSYTEEEITYRELLTNLSLNGELIITIPVEKEEEVKLGLKNLKYKQTARVKGDPRPKVEEILEFYSTVSKEYENCVDLRIILRKKGAIFIKKLVIPDNTF